MKKPIFVLLRGLKWLALGVVGLVVVVLGCWLLLPDEALNPEARKILEAQPTVPPEQNVYFALVGLIASPELDAVQVGRKLVEDHAAVVREKGFVVRFDASKYWGAHPYKRPIPGGAYCRSHGETAHCLTALRQHRGELEAQLVAQDVYVSRYRALRTYPHHDESMTPAGAMLVSYQPHFDLGELVDASIAFRMEEPAQRAGALGELLEDIRLWERAGRESDVFISRMMYAAILHKKYKLLSELLTESPRLAQEQPDLVAQLTKPLEAPYTDMKRVWRGEFRYGAQWMKSMPLGGITSAFLGLDNEDLSTWQRYLASRLFRYNATVNLYYEEFRSASEFYAQSAADIQAGHDAFAKRRYRANLFDPRYWLYNPVGKDSVSVPAEIYDSYRDRLTDLVGYTRLIELQRQILAARTPPEKIPAFLASVDAALRNPYTGQPMHYDSATNSISFMPKSPNYAKKGAPLVVTLAR